MEQTHCLRVYMKHLREKLELHPSEPAFFISASPTNGAVGGPDDSVWEFKAARRMVLASLPVDLSETE